MDKEQTVHSFWSGFDLPAYDEGTVPDDAVMPYITYAVATDSIGFPVALTGSIWYKATEWETISNKKDQIARSISGHLSLPFEGGFLYLTKGTPFAQRLADPDDTIRRIYINIMAEYLSAF